MQTHICVDCGQLCKQRLHEYLLPWTLASTSWQLHLGLSFHTLMRGRVCCSHDTLIIHILGRNVSKPWWTKVDGQDDTCRIQETAFTYSTIHTVIQNIQIGPLLVLLGHIKH